MTTATTLNHIALAYTPYIERSRAVAATRLTVFPLRPGAAPDAAGLLAALTDVWPEGGGRALLNVAGEPLMADLLRQRPAANVMIEVPAFMAADAAQRGALATLRERRTPLLVKGASAAALPAEVLSCFSAAIVDAGMDGSPLSGDAAPAGLPRVQDGVSSRRTLDVAFDVGAQAVLGWPFGAAPAATRVGSKNNVAASLQVLMQVMQQLEGDEPVERIEPTLRRDPKIAFRLLRYINSPAFGLRVEVSSFGHALALLGRQRLKRWLALLLVTASDDPAARPAMFAAVRRGLLMEEFAKLSGDDDMRSEMFLCGVFSLLDRMFDQPLGQLLASVPLPERVVQTLIDGSGPYCAWLDLVRAVEGGSLAELRAAAECVLLDIGEVNGALLRALAAAARLD